MFKMTCIETTAKGVPCTRKAISGGRCTQHHKKFLEGGTATKVKAEAKELTKYDDVEAEGTLEDLFKAIHSELKDHRGTDMEVHMEELLTRYKIRYIRHPLGPQCSPDFFVMIGGRVHQVELKSSTAGAPVWNGGIPKQHRIYILNLPKHSKAEPVICVMGSDLIMDIQAKTLYKINIELKKIAKTLLTGSSVGG